MLRNFESKEALTRKKVALIGPISKGGGIATVVNAMTSVDKIKIHYEVMFFNTSNYKDSTTVQNSIIFIQSALNYFIKLVKHNIDLAHIHTSYGRSFYRKSVFILLSKLFKVKVILHIHSSKFDDFFIDASGIRKKLIEFFFKKTDSVVLLCNDWMDKITKKYSIKNAVVINNPVPFDLAKVKIGERKPTVDSITILFLGFLIKTKGIYDLIEIAQKLNGSPFTYKILVCGKGEEESSFVKKIKERDLDNIEYLGWVSGETKLDLFRTSDIFLLPSYKEGMPMVILEAMAFGLPIISTCIAGIPDMVKEGINGYLLESGDIDGFVEKIKILSLDKPLRETFGNESRNLVKCFDKEKISEKWDILYKETLGVT